MSARPRAGRVYLAGRYSKRHELSAFALQAEAQGWRVVARWLNGDHELGDVHTEADRVRLAREDFEDCVAAGVVVSFTEEPRKPSTARGGRHVEFGIALMTGARLVVVGHRENVFHHLPQVEFAPTATEALALLGQAPEARP